MLIVELASYTTPCDAGIVVCAHAWGARTCLRMCNGFGEKERESCL